MQTFRLKGERFFFSEVVLELVQSFRPTCMSTLLLCLEQRSILSFSSGRDIYPEGLCDF